MPSIAKSVYEHDNEHDTNMENDECTWYTSKSMIDNDSDMGNLYGYEPCKTILDDTNYCSKSQGKTQRVFPKPIQLATLTCNCVLCAGKLIGNPTIDCEQKWVTNKDVDLYVQKKMQCFDRVMAEKHLESLVAIKNEVDKELESYIDLPTESKAFRERRIRVEREKSVVTFKRTPTMMKTHRRKGGGKGKKGPIVVSNETIQARKAEKRRNRKIIKQKQEEKRKIEFEEKNITTHKIEIPIVVIEPEIVDDDTNTDSENDNDNMDLEYFKIIKANIPKYTKDDIDLNDDIVWKKVPNKKYAKPCPTIKLGLKCGNKKCQYNHIIPTTKSETKLENKPETKSYDDPSKKRTILCNSVIRKVHCRHGTMCRFAHNKEELVITNCSFSNTCVFVTKKNGIYYNNTSKDKVCGRKHLGESIENVYTRLGLDSKPEIKPTPKPEIKSDTKNFVSSFTFSQIVSSTTVKDTIPFSYSSIVANTIIAPPLPTTPPPSLPPKPLLPTTPPPLPTTLPPDIEDDFEIVNSKKQVAICKYYLEGKECPHAKCRFSHGDIMEPKINICKHFTDNKICMHDNCSKSIQEYTYEKAIDILTDENKIAIKKKCTKMCESIVNGIPCRHGTNCRFAHSRDELVIGECFFGTLCKYTKHQGCGIYKNISSYICLFKHPGETKNSYNTRVKTS